MFFVADRIACCRELKPDSGGDITGIYLFQIGALVGVHLKDAAKALLFIFCGIQNVGTGMGHS